MGTKLAANCSILAHSGVWLLTGILLLGLVIIRRCCWLLCHANDSRDGCVDDGPES